MRNTAHTHVYVWHAQEKYWAELRQAAADPENCVSADRLSVERSYLTSVCQKLAVSFVCRHCGFFGKNCTWIKHLLRCACKNSKLNLFWGNNKDAAKKHM